MAGFRVAVVLAITKANSDFFSYALGLTKPRLRLDSLTRPFFFPGRTSPLFFPGLTSGNFSLAFLTLSLKCVKTIFQPLPRILDSQNDKPLRPNFLVFRRIMICNKLLIEVNWMRNEVVDIIE